ncbi:MAG: hypothetical protein DRG31_04735 [Deltaproteobacteria bacterium]|nr:MAG: hypothetical protein DRG31_04735 [Deltaproteobacteria bacterium]
MFEGVVIIALYFAVILGGHPFVVAILRGFRIPFGDEGLERAGRIIGYLERFIVLTFLLQGQYSAIALIFTGKSILRFRSLGRAEYYLVGTLAGFSWAILWGVLACLIREMIV